MKNKENSTATAPVREVPRTYEMVSDQQQREFPKASGATVLKGQAVALDQDGHVVPFAPGGRFLGFCTGQTATKCAVQVRGSIVLLLRGVTEDHAGTPVFCDGPNSFSIEKRRGSAEVGKVRYSQNERCAVAFRREGDEKPLNLRVDRA